MTFLYRTGQALQALDINSRIGQLGGYGVVDGGEPSIGSRPFGIDFRRAEVALGNETYTLDARGVDLQDYSTADQPRKVVVYIAPAESGEGAEYRVAAGDPAQPRPEGKLRFDTYEPAPPDLSRRAAAPVVEVWIGANAAQLIDEDYRDRRLPSELIRREFSARSGSGQTIIDGAGVEHHGELGTAAQYSSEEDILEAINTDPLHGRLEAHTYFSASHSDLSDIGEEDHHTRPTDVDDRATVRGGVDASDLASTSARTAGMHLAVPDGIDSVWEVPALAESPVLDTDTITHTGGGTTTTLIEDVAPSHLSAADISVGVSVEEPPAWDADYAYSKTVSTQWDSASESANVELTLPWATDPGAGNDLTLRYTIVDMRPERVNDLYNPSDAVGAINGQTISPADLFAQDTLNLPTYDELPGDAISEQGDTIIGTGNGSADWGIYQYDGAAWSGPHTTGLTSLSELAINSTKSWNDEPILDIGPATASADLLQLDQIGDHAEIDDAHHTPVTSSDIDHAGMSNVQPDQHHPAPTGETIGRSVAGKIFDVSVEVVRIPDSDRARVFAVLDDDEHADIVRGEFMDVDRERPSGLSLQIVDRDTRTTLYQQTSSVQSGSATDPIASIAGPRKLDIRIQNETGSEVVAGGGVSYRLYEPELVYGSTITMPGDIDTKQVNVRQGVVVEPTTPLAGVRARISSMVSGLTQAYIQEPGDGEILAQEDISDLSNGDSFELRASRTIRSDERVYVYADAGGESYIRGRYGDDSGIYPYTSSDFTIPSGVFTRDGALSTSHRYNLDEIQAIRLE